VAESFRFRQNGLKALISNMILAETLAEMSGSIRGWHRELFW